MSLVYLEILLISFQAASLGIFCLRVQRFFSTESRSLYFFNGLGSSFEMHYFNLRTINIIEVNGKGHNA